MNITSNLNFDQDGKPDFLISKAWRETFEGLTDHQAKLLIVALYQLNCDGAVDAAIMDELAEDPLCGFLYSNQILPYTERKLQQYAEVSEKRRMAVNVRWAKREAEQPDDEG